MGRYICVIKTYCWGRLFKVGDPVTILPGNKIPGEERKDEKTGKVEKISYFRLVSPKKGVAPALKKLTSKQKKTFENKLAALAARSNLTASEKAEKERILTRLSVNEEEAPLAKTPTAEEIEKAKEDALKKREGAVESAQGPVVTSMAQTEEMKHKEAEGTSQQTLTLEDDKEKG